MYHVSNDINYALLIAPTLWLLVALGGRRFQRSGPSPTLGSLRPSHQFRHKSLVRNTHPPNGVDDPINYTSRHILSCHFLLVWHYVYIGARSLQCIFKFGIGWYMLFLGSPLAILDLFLKDLNYSKPTYFDTHLGWPYFRAFHIRLVEPSSRFWHN